MGIIARKNHVSTSNNESDDKIEEPFGPVYWRWISMETKVSKFYLDSVEKSNNFILNMIFNLISMIHNT